jgi:hypothetical protein
LTVNLTRIFKRLVSGDNATEGDPAALRNIIVWLFIALVALFLTNPAGEPRSFFDKPVPMPKELGLQ